MKYNELLAWDQLLALVPDRSAKTGATSSRATLLDVVNRIRREFSADPSVDSAGEAGIRQALLNGASYNEVAHLVGVKYAPDLLKYLFPFAPAETMVWLTADLLAEDVRLAKELEKQRAATPPGQALGTKT